MSLSDLTVTRQSGLFFSLVLILAILSGWAMSLASPPLITGVVLLLCLMLVAVCDMKTALLILILLRINLDAFHDQISIPLGSLNALSLPSVLGVLLLFLGSVYILTKRVSFWKHPLARPFGLFFLACGLSVPFSTNLFQGIAELSELASFAVLFILVVDILRSDRDIRKMVWILLLSSLVPLAVGLIQICSNFSLSAFTFEPSFRVSATLTHPNAYAFYLVMITVLSMSVYLQENSEANKLLLRLLIPLLMFSLLFTYTRGAWIGLVIAVFALGVLKKRKLLILTPLAVYGMILIFPVIFHRFESILNPDLFRYDSLAWRLRLWGASFPYFLSHPFLGNGLGTFQLVAFQVDDWFAAAHNDYLRMLVETGLVGFSGYIILVVSLARLGIKACRRAADSFQRQVSLGFLSFLIAYLAMSVADNLFNHGGIQWYLWAYAGIVAAIYRLNQPGKDREECPSSQAS